MAAGYFDARIRVSFKKRHEAALPWFSSGNSGESSSISQFASRATTTATNWCVLTEVLGRCEDGLVMHETRPTITTYLVNRVRGLHDSPADKSDRSSVGWIESALVSQR